MSRAPGPPLPARPCGDSRSDAVGRGQHPPGVDQGAPAEVFPVLGAESQAHLPGPLAPRGLPSPYDACSLQGLVWGWGRKGLQDTTRPSHRVQPFPVPAPPWASLNPPTHPWACGGWGEGTETERAQGQDSPAAAWTRLTRRVSASTSRWSIWKERGGAAGAWLGVCGVWVLWGGVCVGCGVCRVWGLQGMGCRVWGGGGVGAPGDQGLCPGQGVWGLSAPDLRLGHPAPQ